MKNDKVMGVLILIIICSAVIVLSLIAAPRISDLFSSNNDAATVGYSSDTVRARVLSISPADQGQENGEVQDYLIAEIEILEGEFFKKRVMMDFGRNQTLPDDYDLDINDEILVSIGVRPAEQAVGAYFIDFVRSKALLLIFAVFIMIAFLVGSMTGLRSLLGMLIGLAVIVLFIIPQIADGKNPVVVSIFGSIIFLGFSLYLVYGWKAMTHAAVLSMAISLGIAGFLSFVFIRLARLTGFGNENMMFLIQQSVIPIDMRGILLAGIIIGSLGVLDDLVVGQSSAVFQLYAANSNLSFKDLFDRAMIIGRDHVSASVNTLVLAYAGESLPMLLLFSITNVNLGMAINVSYIAEEIVRALAGTIGLFISIPIATAMACFWVKKD